MRKRSAVVALTILTSLIAGCGEDEDDAGAQVCVDSVSGTRVDDDECADANATGSPFLWYYLGRSAGSAPPVGHRVTGGSYTKPATGSYYSVPKSGGFGTHTGTTGG